MPTYGWIYERSEEHLASLLDPVDPFRPGGVASGRVPCPFCERTFDDDRAWGTHLAVEHPVDPPVLLVDRVPFWKAGTVRRALVASSIEVANATSMSMGTPGATLEPVDMAGLRTALADGRKGALEVEMVNSRCEDRAVSTRRTLLRFDVPDAEELRAVETAFTASLAQDRIRMDDIMEFRRLSDGAGGELYRAALGDFAMAVAARSGDSAATLSAIAVTSKLRATVETLADFIDRPLACTVLVSARVALGDGSVPFPSTGVAELDRAATALHALSAGQELPSPADQRCHASSMLAVCPVDPITAELVHALALLRTPAAPALVDLFRRLARSPDRMTRVVAAAVLIRLCDTDEVAARSWRQLVRQAGFFRQPLERYS